jgi:hypothetical protein
LPGQQDYKELLECRFEKFNPNWRPSQYLGRADSIERNFLLWRAICETPVRLLPTLNFFPKFAFEKESKMKWCYEPTPPPSVLDTFRQVFQSFLGKYAPNEIFAPPPQSSLKTGPNRYNDGGKIKFDFEKADSYDSWFEYQRFVTQPLQMREVWVPSKGFKLNSSYWFEITRPILNKVPYALLGLDGGDFIKKVNSRKRKCCKNTFDFYGFGLQFWRELLRIAMEEIAYLYPNALVSEAADIGIGYLSKVELRRDGKFEYPIRGIGLGYYETLKTLCVMSIIDKYDPILCWGDEGLVDEATYDKIADDLSFYGFFLNHEKKKSFKENETIFWGGLVILPNGKVAQPHGFTELIPPVFQAKTHWERKAGANVLSLPTYGAYPRLAYVYERTFGFEFFRGESLLNPLNGGLNRRAPEMRGFTRTAHIERFRQMGIRNLEDVLYEIPQFIINKHVNKMNFSKKRRGIFRNGEKTSTYTRDYMYPRMFKGMKKPERPLHDLAKFMPLWKEKRMMLYNSIHCEKFTRGLTKAEMLSAVLKYSRHPNPFDAYSTDSKYRDSYICDPILSDEWEYLIDEICKMKKVSDFKTLRADLLTEPEKELLFIRQANALEKHRSDPDTSIRINRLIFGEVYKKGLESLKRGIEEVDPPDTEEDDNDQEHKYLRLGTPEENIPIFSEETHYGESFEEVLFLDQEENDYIEKMVFIEDRFEPLPYL